MPSPGVHDDFLLTFKKKKKKKQLKPLLGLSFSSEGGSQIYGGHKVLERKICGS